LMKYVRRYIVKTTQLDFNDKEIKYSG
jgi:hypothetical protein